MLDIARNILKSATGVDKSLSDLSPINNEKSAKMLTRGNKHTRINFFWLKRWVNASELNRVLRLLELPVLQNDEGDIVLKNECIELSLEHDKQIRIVKAKEKVHFEFN